MRFSLLKLIPRYTLCTRKVQPLYRGFVDRYTLCTGSTPQRYTLCIYGLPQRYTLCTPYIFTKGLGSLVLSICYSVMKMKATDIQTLKRQVGKSV